MPPPSSKLFSRKLDKITELAKQRVRIGGIVYSTKKDAEKFDKRNWLQEASEEIADLVAYATFCYIQMESLYYLLLKHERVLIEEVKEGTKNANVHNNIG